jgi:hypothetical protein
MVGLPRSIIKKYGVSKKAWAVFRGGKTSTRKTKRRGGSMARRGRRGGSKGGFGGLLSQNNLIGTLGGAYIAPQLGISPAIGGAVGSYMMGKKGIMGAAVGYFAAPLILGMINKGGSTVSSAVLY